MGNKVPRSENTHTHTYNTKNNYVHSDIQFFTPRICDILVLEFYTITYHPLLYIVSRL